MDLGEDHLCSGVENIGSQKLHRAMRPKKESGARLQEINGSRDENTETRMSRTPRERILICFGASLLGIKSIRCGEETTIQNRKET